MKTPLLLILLLAIHLSAFSNTGFRENSGQIKNQNGQPATAVRYFLQCDGYNVQLRHDGFSYDFIRRVDEEIIIDRVDFIFENFNPNYSIEKIFPKLPYKTNYVADNGKPQYEKIIYKNFYEGIDIVFKRKGEELFEYDFVISDNGNINAIVFHVQGADIRAIQENQLFMGNEFIQFKETIPLSYDVKGNKVDVSFKSDDQKQIKLSCKQLHSGITIDPTPELLYATYTREGWSIWDIKYLDNMDYITIGFGNPVNVATEGAYQTVLIGFGNVILSRFDTSNNLVWSTYFGEDITAAYEFEIIEDKIVFIGIAEGNNLPTEGAYQTSNNGGRDIIVGIFTTNGDFVHCTYFGGSQYDQANDIAYIGNGKVAIGGRTESSNFPTINSSSTHSGGTDGFVAVFDINEKLFVSSFLVGGTDFDAIEDIIPSDNGSFVFTGWTRSPGINVSGLNPPPTIFSETPNVAGGWDEGIIGNVNANLEIEFLGFLGGAQGDKNLFGARTIENKLILISASSSEDLPFTANADLTNIENEFGAAIVYIFDESFNLEYCSQLFASFPVFEGDVISDEFGHIYIHASTTSATNVATSDALYPDFFLYPFTTNPSYDAALIQLAPTGQKLWGTYFGNYTLQTSLGIDYLNSKLIICGVTGSDSFYPSDYQSSFLTSDAFGNTVNTSTGFIAIFDQLVNVSELEHSENNIHVFPNPTSDMLYLNGEDLQQAKCVIYDITGKPVYSYHLNSSAINIEILPSGVYTLTLQTPSSFRTAKFIKQ